MAKKFYCNMCGKQMDILDIQENFSVNGRLGYGSRYDGDEIEFDLCCDCMDKLIEECAIPPVKSLRPVESLQDQKGIKK